MSKSALTLKDSYALIIFILCFFRPSFSSATNSGDIKLLITLRNSLIQRRDVIPSWFDPEIPTTHTSNTASLNFALRINPLHSSPLHNLQIFLLLNPPPSAPPTDNCETLMKPEPSSQFKPLHKIFKVQCTCSNHMAIFSFKKKKKTLDVKRFYLPIYFIYSLLPYILK